MAGEILECPKCGRRNRVPASAAGVPRCGSCHQPLPWMTVADDRTFHEVVEASPVPVVVDLWATWCGPCRVVSPALERVARAMAGRIKLVKVDVDVSPALSQHFQVRAVPTLLVMKGGRVLARRAGAAGSGALREWVEQALTGQR